VTVLPTVIMVPPRQKAFGVHNESVCAESEGVSTDSEGVAADNEGVAAGSRRVTADSRGVAAANGVFPQKVRQLAPMERGLHR
jgi:hypothetical protein